MESRKVKNMIVVGRQGSGKSTALRRLVLASAQAGRRVLVVTPNDDDWADIPLLDENRMATFRGIRRAQCDQDEERALSLGLRFSGGMLVYDDARSNFSDLVTTEKRAFISRLRHRDIDLFSVSHGFTDTPPLFFTHATHYLIFATTDDVSRRRRYLGGWYETIAQTVQRVNRKALADPHYYECISV